MNKREIHEFLLQEILVPFYRWKNDGKHLSFFQKRILDYQYKIRRHVWDGEPIKLKHQGWPRLPPMTPQAWTIMEILNSIEFTQTLEIDEVMDGFLFISSYISPNEVDALWEEIIDVIPICTEQTAPIWVAVVVSFAMGVTSTDTEDSSKPEIQDFFTQEVKINIMREINFNPLVSFDSFMEWLYNDGPAPSVLNYLFSSLQRSLEHIHLPLTLHTS